MLVIVCIGDVGNGFSTWTWFGDDLEILRLRADFRLLFVHAESGLKFTHPIFSVFVNV